jgi:activator of HSP90 ATPase
MFCILLSRSSPWPSWHSVKYCFELAFFYASIHLFARLIPLSLYSSPTVPEEIKMNRSRAQAAMHDAAPAPLTRRNLFVGALLGAGGLAAAPIHTWASVADQVSHSTEAIHQEVVFKAPRKRVYCALMKTAQFDKVAHLGSAVQGNAPLGNQPTQISPDVGGTFTLFGGHIVGRHLELVPDTRIVQAWRVADWDAGIFSIVRFQLVDQASDTKLVFDHVGFPQGLGQHLAEGWTGNYWQPLAKFLA